MAKILHYYAHPGERYSTANRAMQQAVTGLDGVTPVDLYAEYPRHDINIAREQARLAEADIIILQFPILWYSVPSLLKEWIDLVFEHGWAYGTGGDKLRGKTLLLAVTTGAPEEAYNPEGFQNYPLRTFLTPLEQTARLCQMRFIAPYVLFGAPHGDHAGHAEGFATLLRALHDGTYDLDRAAAMELVTADTLPILKGASA